MICGYIYKIIFPNGKHYIGLTTTSLEKRHYEHKFFAKNGDAKYLLYKALNKYDMIDTFELIEIDTADTIEELYKKEIDYIIQYNSYYINGNGYNMTYGGDGTHGYVYTEENKQKMSESQIKRFKNPKEIEKVSKRMKKRYENPEEIKKISEAHKKYFEENPEKCKEHSEKMKKRFEENPEFGKIHSEKMKKYYKENPEKGKECYEKIKKWFEEHPELRKELNEKMKLRFKDNPDERRKMARGTNKPFDIFTLDGKFIKTFTYQFEAKEFIQKEYNVNSSNLYQVLSGKRKSCAGFVFKYKS